MFISLKNRVWILLIFFMISEQLFSQTDDLKTNINAISFNSILYHDEFLDEQSYIDFLREHIFSQPEFKYASAIKNEKDLLLKSAKRERLPTLSGRVINDESFDRNVEDKSSIRKRQDDSFDAVLEINQPLYLGGKINGQINYAYHESTMANVQREIATSKLILEANDIYLSAVIYFHLYQYANELIEILEPFREKMKDRSDSGAIDPVEYAVFQAKLNKFRSSIYTLEATSKKSLANFENTFEKTFNFKGFPKVTIDVTDAVYREKSLELLSKESKYLASLENVKITKSDYRPQIGIQARYTEYDIDKDNTDTDIRGGIYLTFPIFDFGRGKAKINASKAKAKSAHIDIDIEKKSNDVTENEIITVIESSFKANLRLKEVFEDTKKQRQIIQDRIMYSGFSASALVDASENELIQLQMLLESEYQLLTGYYNLLHQNRGLLNKLRFIL